MAGKLKFHIDSERAYEVNKAASYGASIGTGANFEEYLTKGDVNKKSAF